MNLVNNDRMTKIISVVLSVVFGVLFVSLVASAVTTISTNIATDGNATITGTLGVTGHTTLTTASSTITSQTGNFMVNGYATTTASNGNIETSGDITVTTANNATSTITVGCVQMYATSTATAVHLTFGSAAHATTTTQGVTSTGLVAWIYGACPI